MKEEYAPSKPSQLGQLGLRISPPSPRSHIQGLHHVSHLVGISVFGFFAGGFALASSNSSGARPKERGRLGFDVREPRVRVRASEVRWAPWHLPDLVSSALDLGFSYNPEIEGFSKWGGGGRS